MPAPRKPSPQIQRKIPTAKSAKATLAQRSREIADECLAWSTRSLARKITQVYEARFAKHGLTSPQFFLMNLIAGAKDDTLGAIAAGAGLDPSTLTRNLQGLEKLGLVEVANVEADQRRRAVWLTEAGARKLQAAIPAWEAAQEEVAEKLGAGFRAGLRKAGGAF
jgi:DNA-binding MarR family transcriptional regulator